MIRKPYSSVSVLVVASWVDVVESAMIPDPHNQANLVLFPLGFGGLEDGDDKRLGAMVPKSVEPLAIEFVGGGHKVSPKTILKGSGSIPNVTHSELEGIDQGVDCVFGYAVGIGERVGTFY